MGTWDNHWREWSVIANSRGYGTSVFYRGAHCLVKVGDELRHAQYQDGRWDDFASVGGGRLRSDPVLHVADVYGVGLEGQLVYNHWLWNEQSWRGWQDLGSPFGEILGKPAVTRNHIVVVKGGDNRLYVRRSSDRSGATWDPWEQSDRLKSGQFTGNPFAFTINEHRRSAELVIAGRSMENEMASISRAFGPSSAGASDALWSDWVVVGNSRGYSSPIVVRDPELHERHCFVKVGDEIRHARYQESRWDGFAAVDGGRFLSDPVVGQGTNDAVEVYGVGLNGDLARNVWPAGENSWNGWKDLGAPVAGIAGTPTVLDRRGERFVVAKGGDNRPYLLYSRDHGETWEPWEQGETLGQGIIKGDISAFIDPGNRNLVIAGRSMENEMASISLTIT